MDNDMEVSKNGVTPKTMGPYVHYSGLGKL